MAVKPGRWLLGLLLALMVAAVCIRLGFWQLDRLATRRAYNAAVAAATAEPPLRLDESTLHAIARDPDAFLYRRATAEGEFVPGADVVLRGRSHLGQPGAHLVSALRLTDGGVILVNRGWVPSPDATTVDPRPFRTDGRVAVVGLLQEMPPPDAELAPLPVEVADTTIVTYRRLGPVGFPLALSSTIPPLYLQALPDSASASAAPPPPVPVPPPALDEGPHLGYAVQWFSFAAIAIGGFLVTSWIRRKRAPDRPVEGV